MQEDKADDTMQGAKDDGSAEAMAEQSGGNSDKRVENGKREVPISHDTTACKRKRGHGANGVVEHARLPSGSSEFDSCGIQQYHEHCKCKREQQCEREGKRHSDREQHCECKHGQ